MPKLTHRLSPVAALAAVALTFAAACSGPEPDKLDIGVPADHPGLALKVTGENVGLETAIGRYIARDLGSSGRKEVGFRTLPGRSRGVEVANHQVTMSLGTDPVSEARADEVVEVGPYLVGGLRLATRADATATAPAALSGRPVCVVVGSYAERRLAELVPGARPRAVATISTCLTDVVEKRADAALEDGVVLAGYAVNPAYADLEVQPRQLTRDEHMILVAKDDPALCSAVTASLRRMVSSGAWRTAVVGDLVTPGILDVVPAAPTVRGCD